MRLTALLALMLAALPVHADGVQPLAAVQRAAHEFLAAQVRSLKGEARIEVGEVDPNLRLAACERPLENQLVAGARVLGNTTVNVRCTGRSPWSLYLPARVQVFADVLVAARPLPRGVPLTAADLMPSRQDLAAAPGGAVTVPGQALGKRLRYPVAAGSVLGAGMLESPPLVHRGRPVTIVSGNAGFEVRVAGEALADAAGGDNVRVRNLLTRKVIEGTVQAENLVRVPM